MRRITSGSLDLHSDSEGPRELRAESWTWMGGAKAGRQEEGETSAASLKRYLQFLGTVRSP